jgi:hypothetical protein
MNAWGMWFDPDTHLFPASDGDLGCSPSLVIVRGGIVDSRTDVPTGNQRLIPAAGPARPAPAPALVLLSDASRGCQTPLLRSEHGASEAQIALRVLGVRPSGGAVGRPVPRVRRLGNHA